MTSPYRLTEAIAFLKPLLRLPRIQRPTRSLTPRAAFTASHAPRATHNTSTGPAAARTGPSRRAVTVTNDTGSVRWDDLSISEKAARTTQQGVNLVVVAAGVVLTATISYILYTTVFSSTSVTAFFNRSVTLLRAHSSVQSLLGPGPEIRAFGQASASRLGRNRHLPSSTETDKWGTEHIRFIFYVEGPRDKGTVHVHLSRRPGESEFVYEELSVDVKGHTRIHVESREEQKGKVAPKIFGVKWW